jgi:hypothetical protein
MSGHCSLNRLSKMHLVRAEGSAEDLRRQVHPVDLCVLKKAGAKIPIDIWL